MNTVDGCNEGVSTKTAGRNLCESFNKLHVRRTSKSCYYEDNLLVQTKLFLLQNDEVDPAIPSKFQDLVQRLKKFLQDVPKHIRRSKQCVEDFYRMLLFLQDYLSRYIEVFKQYPLTQDLTSLLVEYVELEYEVLYLGNCYSPEYQKQVENRLLTYLLMFLYGSTVKKGTNIVDGSAINALYIIKNVRPDYKREHDLIENLTRKLLTKLNVLDAVNEIRKQDIDLVNAEKFFQAPRLQEISKQLQNIASIIDSPESDDEIQEIDIPRPMRVKSEPTEAKVDLSKYPCFNLEENLRSESDDRHVHSNNSDKCKYEHYNCSTSSFSDEPINISDDDNSDVEFTEEAPVSVIDLEDGVEKIGAGVSVHSQNDAFVSDVNANTTTNIPFGSDSTKAQTQNLRKRDDVIINESVQIQEKDDASFNAHLEQNLNNQKCGVKKNNVVYVSDDEDNEVEIVQLLPVVVDQKSNSVESIKLLHNNKESENVITVVQDQNKCLDDNVFDREIHCAVNDIQTAEKPQVGEIISEESTKDSGTAVESLNDFILDIDISNSLNINSTQSKSTTVFEDDETNISKSIINQLEYAIQCSGTFRSNGIGNNVDNVVSKQLPYDLVEEEILISEAVVIQGETVAVLTANEVIAEQTDVTSTVQEEAIDSISLITTEVSEEVVEGLTSSAQPENEIIIQQVEDTTEKSVKLVEITTNKISEEQVDEPTLTSGSVSVEKEIIVRPVDDATIELTTQPEHQNLDEIIVVDNTTLLQEKEVESNSIRTNEISQDQTDGSTVEQEETIDSIPLTAVAVEEVIVGPINNATIESAVQPENENLEEIIAEQARHATILPGKTVDTVAITNEISQEQTDGQEQTLGKEETVAPIPLSAVEVEEEVILGQLNDATIESSVQPENENSEDIIAEQAGHATIFPEKAVATVGHEEIVDSIPLTAIAIEEEIIIGQVDDTTVQSIAQPENQILQNDTSVDSIAQPENQLIEEIVEQVDDTTVESIAQRENKLLKQVADATIVSIAQPEHDISDDTVMEQVDDSAIIQEEVIETIASHTYETSTEIVTEQIEDAMIEEVTEHLAQNYPSTTKGISQQILMEQIHDTMVVQEVLEPIVSNINDICEEIVMEQVDETMIEEEVIDNILQNETSEDEHASEKCSIDDSGVFENSLDAGSERSEMQSHEVSTNDELIKMGDDVGIESSTSNEVHSSDNQGDGCSNKYEDQPDETQASKIVNSDSSSCLQRTPISVTNSFEGRETDVTNEDKLAENDPVKAMDERNSKNSILYEETLSQAQVIEMKDLENNEINQMDATKIKSNQENQPTTTTEVFSRNLYVLANAASGHFTNAHEFQLQPNFVSENEIKPSENVEQETDLRINEGETCTIEPVLDEHISNDYVHEETVITEPGAIFTEQNCSNNLVVLAAAAAKRKKVESLNVKGRKRNKRDRKKNKNKESLERSIPRRVTRSATVSKLTITNNDVQDNSKCIPSTFMNLENLVTPPPICVYNFIPSVTDEESIDEPFSSVKNLQEILARNVAYDEDTVDDKIVLVVTSEEVDSEVIISIPETEKDIPGINYDILNQTEEFSANTNLSLSTSEELCKELKLTMTKNKDAMSVDVLELSNLLTTKLNEISLHVVETDSSTKLKRLKQKKKSPTHPMPIKKRRRYEKNGEDIPSLIENATEKPATVQVPAKNMITEDPEIKSPTSDRPFPTKASLKCFHLSRAVCNPYVQLQKLPVNSCKEPENRNSRVKIQEKTKIGEKRESRSLSETKPETLGPKKIKTRRTTLHCVSDRENNKNCERKINDNYVTRRRKTSKFPYEMLMDIENGLEIKEIPQTEELTIKPNTRSLMDKSVENVEEKIVMRTRSKMKANNNTKKNSVPIIESDVTLELKNISTHLENEVMQHSKSNEKIANDSKCTTEKNLRVNSRVKNNSKKRTKKPETLIENDNNSVHLINELLPNTISDATKCDLNSDKVDRIVIGGPDEEKRSEIIKENLSAEGSYCELETESLQKVESSRDARVADSEIPPEVTDSIRNLEIDAEKLDERKPKNQEEANDVRGLENNVSCIDEKNQPEQTNAAVYQPIESVEENCYTLDELSTSLNNNVDQTEEQKELHVVTKFKANNSNSTNRLRKYVRSRSKDTHKDRKFKNNSNVSNKRGRHCNVSMEKTSCTNKLKAECDKSAIKKYKKANSSDSNHTIKVDDLEVDNTNPKNDSEITSIKVMEERDNAFLDDKEMVQGEDLDVNENSFLHKEDVSLIPLPDEEPLTKSEPSLTILNSKTIEISTSNAAIRSVSKPIVELENCTAEGKHATQAKAILVEKIDGKSVENNLLCSDNETPKLWTIDNIINTNDRENRTPTQECTEETTNFCQNEDQIIPDKDTEKSTNSDNIGQGDLKNIKTKNHRQELICNTSDKPVEKETSDLHPIDESDKPVSTNTDLPLLIPEKSDCVRKKKSCSNEKSYFLKEGDERQDTTSLTGLAAVYGESIVSCENVLNTSNLQTGDDSVITETILRFEEKFDKKLKVNRRHSISTETCVAIQDSNRGDKQILEKYNIECTTIRKIFKRNQFHRTDKEKVDSSVTGVPESVAVVLNPEFSVKDNTELLTIDVIESKQLSDDDEVVLVSVEKLLLDEVKTQDNNEYAYEIEPNVEKIFEKYSKMNKNNAESDCNTIHNKRKLSQEKRVAFNPQKDTVKIIKPFQYGEEVKNVPSNSKRRKIEDDSFKRKEKREKNKQEYKKHRHAKNENKSKELRREKSKKLDVTKKIEKTNRELKSVRRETRKLDKLPERTESLQKVAGKRNNSTNQEESRKMKRKLDSGRSSKTVPESSKKIKHVDIVKDKQKSKQPDEKQEMLKGQLQSTRPQKKSADLKQSDSVGKVGGIVADNGVNVPKEQHYQTLLTKNSSVSVNKEVLEILKQIENENSQKKCAKPKQSEKVQKLDKNVTDKGQNVLKEQHYQDCLSHNSEHVNKEEPKMSKQIQNKKSEKKNLKLKQSESVAELGGIVTDMSESIPKKGPDIAKQIEKKSEKKRAKLKQSGGVEKLDEIITDQGENLPNQHHHQSLLTQNSSESVNKEGSEITKQIETIMSEKKHAKPKQSGSVKELDGIVPDMGVNIPKEQHQNKEGSEIALQIETRNFEKKRAKPITDSGSAELLDGIVTDKDKNVPKEEHHQELLTQNSSESVNKDRPEIIKQIETRNSEKKRAKPKQSGSAKMLDGIVTDKDKNAPKEEHYQEHLTQNSSESAKKEEPEIAKQIETRNSEKKRAKLKQSGSAEMLDGIVTDKDKNAPKEEHYQEHLTQNSSESAKKEGPEIAKQIETRNSEKKRAKPKQSGSVEMLGEFVTDKDKKVAKEEHHQEVLTQNSSESIKKEVPEIVKQIERRNSEKKRAKPKQSRSAVMFDGIIDKDEDIPKEERHSQLLTQNSSESVKKEVPEIAKQIGRRNSEKKSAKPKQSGSGVMLDGIVIDKDENVPMEEHHPQLLTQGSSETVKMEEPEIDKQIETRNSEKKLAKPKQSLSAVVLDGIVIDKDENASKEEHHQELSSESVNKKEPEISKQIETRSSENKRAKPKQSGSIELLNGIVINENENAPKKEHHQELLTQNSCESVAMEGSEIAKQIETRNSERKRAQTKQSGSIEKIDGVVTTKDEKYPKKEHNSKLLTQKSSVSVSRKGPEIAKQIEIRKCEKKRAKPEQSRCVQELDGIFTDKAENVTKEHYQELLTRNSFESVYNEGPKITKQNEKDYSSKENIGGGAVIAATGEIIPEKHNADEVFLNEDKSALCLDENNANAQNFVRMISKETGVLGEQPMQQTECCKKEEAHHINIDGCVEEEYYNDGNFEVPISVSDEVEFKKSRDTRRKEFKKIDIIIENLKNKNCQNDCDDSFMTLMVDDKIDHEEHVESTIGPDNFLVETDEQNLVKDGIVQNDVNKTGQYFREFDLDQSKLQAINTEEVQCEDMFPYIEDPKKNNCLLEIDTNEIATSLADNAVSLIDVNKQVDAAEASTSCENLLAEMFPERNRSNKNGFIFFKGSDHNYHSMGDPLLGGECDRNESDHSTDNKEITSPELENVLVNDTILPYLSTLTDNHQESSEDSGTDFQLLELIGNTLARESSPPLTQSINCDNLYQSNLKQVELEYESAANGVEFSKINNEVFINQFQQPTMSVENMSELMNVVINSIQNLNNMSKPAPILQEDTNKEGLFLSSDLDLNKVVHHSQPENLDLSCDFSQAHAPDITSECSTSNTPIIETDYSNIDFMPTLSGNTSVVEEEVPMQKVIVEQVPQCIEEVQPLKINVENNVDEPSSRIKFTPRPKISEAIALSKQNNMSLSKKALNNIGFVRNSSKTKPSAPKPKKVCDQKKEYKTELTPEIESPKAQISELRTNPTISKNSTSSPPKEKSLPIIEDLSPTLNKPEVKVNKPKEGENYLKPKGSPSSKNSRTPRQSDQKLELGEAISQSDMIDNVKRRKRKPVDYSSIEKLLENDEYDFPKSQKSKSKKDDKVKRKQKEQLPLKEEEVKIKKVRVGDDAVPSTSNGVNTQAISLKMRSSIFEDSDDDIPKKKRSKPEPRTAAEVLFDRLVKEGDANKETKCNIVKMSQDPLRPTHTIFSVDAVLQRKIETTPVKQIGVVNPIPRPSNHLRRELLPSRSSYGVEEIRNPSQYYPYYPERSRRSYPYSSRDGRDLRPSSHQGSSRRTEYSTHPIDQRYSSQRSSSSSRSSRSNRHHSNSRSSTDQRPYWFGSGNDLSWREDMKKKFPNVFKDEFF